MTHAIKICSLCGNESPSDHEECEEKARKNLIGWGPKRRKRRLRRKSENYRRNLH